MRAVVVSPKNVPFGTKDGNVTMFFGTGLVASGNLGIELTPHEARDFAAILNRKADEAEAQ